MSTVKTHTHSNVSQSAGRIAKSFEPLHSHSIRQAEEEIAHGFRSVSDIAAAGEGATSAAGQDERQIGMGMAVPVRVSAPIQNHGIVEQ